MPVSYLSKDEALALHDAPSGLVEGIIKLASLGLKTEGIKEYAYAIANDNAPPPLPQPGVRRPLTVQLHSFLKDPRQWSDTYGLPADLIGELSALRIADPAQCRDRVAAAISASPRVVTSQRAVKVVLDGSPGTVSANATPLANVSSFSKSLSAEMTHNSAVYGMYKFEAFETSLDLTQRFAVALGKNFFVVTFSKKNAVSIARIASVKGRRDPLAAPYVVYVDSSGRILRDQSISADAWDCTREPRESVPSCTRSLGALPSAPATPAKQQTEQRTGSPGLAAGRSSAAHASGATGSVVGN